ncbi:tRNA(His) 5'-end guanylyltransferase [Chitinophaga skermanii]|uniref:tRNA(His) guanylyltransferase n=1 Tax=Chitinophaga skermanii TaxID=331697 RepID=A0A327QDC9_9BACT|nr:tRNA(His) guanylyltransferase Thg1 family protein [Chitinophaga skermanii]RAJ02311.1 tRNA(His) 5'-end guanylyltransferase [Chitinophaga skermanii]
MKFEELDQLLRQFESLNDPVALPGMYIVARLDGRGFTQFTKKNNDFEKPFDPQFKENMLATLQHLMNTGFKVTYGYTQSDELSLLFDLKTGVYGRKIRKYTSLLAAEASAKFSLLCGQIATFDCRIIQFPTKDWVVDYFRWRNEDAARNALNAYCYWTMRKTGMDAQAVTAQLSTFTQAEKNELLFQAGINYNEVPNWQKRGIGAYYHTVTKAGYNPLQQSNTITSRLQLCIEENLPMKDAYNELLQHII